MTNIYSYLNLPDFEPKFGLDTSNIIFDLPAGQIQTTGLANSRYTRYHLDPRYVSYMESLMPELTGHIRDIGYQQITNNSDTPSQLFPHTDGERRGKHCIQYLFDTGGTNVKTSWYQEPGHPLFREPKHEFGTAKLVKVAEAVFPAKQWTIFTTGVIHNVEPITASRQAFSVGFTNDALFDLIIERYGIGPTVSITGAG